MSQDANCNRYLSPQQMAVIHYHLRTDFRKVLATHSYNNHLNRNAASDFTVSTSQAWTIDRYFKGNITIKAGATLTLSCQLALTQNARIFVERQAQLIIDGGTITNISGHPWASIHVSGDPGQDQSFNPTTGYGTYQGMLRIKNGGTLSKAGTAVANYTVDANNVVQWGSTGGIIIAENANFIDNSRDVEFLAYSPPSASYFKNCQFKTIGRIGSSLQPFAHVSFYKVNNVRFMGCNFEYAAGTTYTAHGMGLWGIDAKYSVDKLCGSAGTLCATPSTFKNLDFGIRVLNINPLAVISVNNCSFEGNIYDGMYIHTMEFPVFDQNYFNVPRDVPGNCGMYLNYCKKYTVKNSVFEQEGGRYSMGMFILKSEIGAHLVYRNSFAGFNTAIAALNNNSGYGNIYNGLKMNCNDFTPLANQFDIAMYPTSSAITGFNAPTVMRKQGETVSPTATQLVRNKYGAYCSGSARWFAAGAGTNTLQILHGCNSNSLSAGVTEPNPQPSCSNTIVTATAFPIAFNYTADCLPSLTSSGGTFTSSAEKLANLNSHISDLLNEGIGADQFELQATVATKLNHYLTDSLPSSMDTVIQILTDNPGNMDDADILLVFAYLSKEDYTSAYTLANALNGDRGDWGELLLKLIELYQEPGGIFCTDGEDVYLDFFTDLANNDGKDGQDCAQAFLKVVKGTDYEVFRPYPDAEESERHGQQFATGDSEIKTNSESIKIFPNPAQDVVTIYYNTKEDGQAHVEVKDLLGKVIYTNFIYSENELIIPLKDYGNGLYIITITRSKVLLHKTKLIKQD
ncbi:MAG: T9SS type A sorting domain-containing protein [Bacteroidota bacterium]